MKITEFFKGFIENKLNTNDFNPINLMKTIQSNETYSNYFANLSKLNLPIIEDIVSFKTDEMLR